MANLKIGKLVLRSLFKKPATLMYPINARQWKEKTRGHIEIEVGDCIFCGICSRKCPTNAITVDREKKSWTIQRMQCVQCCCCVEVCPKKCLANAQLYTAPGTEKVVDEFVQEAVPEEAKPDTADE